MIPSDIHMFSGWRCWEEYLPVPLQGLATPWGAPWPWCYPGVPAECDRVSEYLGNTWCGARACRSPQLRGYWAYWNLHSDRHPAEPHCLSRWVCMCVRIEYRGTDITYMCTCMVIDLLHPEFWFWILSHSFGFSLTLHDKIYNSKLRIELTTLCAEC